MADFYTKMEGIAAKLLTRFNQGTFQLIKVTPGAGSTHNPGSAVEAAPVTLKAVSSSAKGQVLLEPGSLVKTGDLLITSKVVAGIEPTTGDLIRIGGDNGRRWRVVRFDKVPPSGSVVVWKIYVRR